MADSYANTADDPRWQAFNQTGFQCACGDRHIGLFPINMLMPLGWEGGNEYAPNEALVMDRDFLSGDYCVLGGHSYALRMRLPLQMRGAAPHAFVFTVWASVNHADFEAYIAAKNAGRIDENARFPARLVNRIAGFHDTGNLMGFAFPQNDGWPPILVLAAAQPYTNRPDHPLIDQQRNGIDLDRALELFAAYGHDMRASASANNN